MERGGGGGRKGKGQGLANDDQEGVNPACSQIVTMKLSNDHNSRMVASGELSNCHEPGGRLSNVFEQEGGGLNQSEQGQRL